MKLERDPVPGRAFLSARLRVAGVWNTFARVTVHSRSDDPSLRQVILLFPDPGAADRWTDHTVEILPALLMDGEVSVSFSHDRLPVGVPFGKVALESSTDRAVEPARAG